MGRTTTKAGQYLTRPSRMGSSGEQSEEKSRRKEGRYTFLVDGGRHDQILMSINRFCH